MTELLVNFIFSARMRPPINVHKFTNKKKRPSHMLRQDCYQDVPFEANIPGCHRMVHLTFASAAAARRVSDQLS